MSGSIKELNMYGVLRACNKIRAAVGRIHINLWDYFMPLDTQKKNLISETSFVNVLSGPLGNLVGLSNQEICELADYFRTQDGRIFYGQFCSIIHEENPKFQKSPQISGEEWEDPLQTNCLSRSEQRKLEIIMTHIVSIINRRKLVLRPYFQDYELISKNCGTVTFTHFGRILHYLGIMLAPEEMNLLLKKFAKDSFTVNYVAFVQVIEEIQDFLDKNGALDKAGNLLQDFSGRVISVKLPKLPRPEFGKIRTACVFPQTLHFLPVYRSSKRIRDVHEVILRIQEHVYKNYIRVAMYFKDFDVFNVGKISPHQFIRALDALRESCLGKLYLSKEEIDKLIAFYRDPNEMDRVCWRTFEDDIEQVFTVKSLDKHPNCKAIAPPEEVKNLPRDGYKEWDCTDKKILPDETMEQLYDKTIKKIMHRTKERRFSLRPFFQDHDKNNRGHVSRAQLRQSLTTASIPLTEKEILSLEFKYNNNYGFHYLGFINNLERLLKESSIVKKKPSCENLEVSQSPDVHDVEDKDVDLILAKIRAKVVCNGIKVNEFLRKFDTLNIRLITRSEFHRGLDMLKCDLTLQEVNTLMDYYTPTAKPEHIDYWKFTDDVEEARAKGQLEKSPLASPVQHVPSEATPRSFLNYDERQILMRALESLASHTNTNLEEVFRDFDSKMHTGAVSKNQLIRALSVCNLTSVISAREIDIIFKCFTVGHVKTDPKFDFISFINTLNIVHENKKIPPA